MGRGRPIGSEVRQNMVEILHFLGKAYGYEIFQVYKKVYPAVTLRLMYYHLRKGVEIGEFKLAKTEITQGEYSWGAAVQRNYYTLGPKARPKVDERVRKVIK